MREQAAESSTCSSIEEYETGLKNRFYLGKRMTPAAFETEQEYHVRRRRMLNRTIHGWGVVEGFAVAPDPDAGPGVLAIDPGVALDEFGRELVQVDPHPLALSDIWSEDDVRKARVVLARQSPVSGAGAGQETTPAESTAQQRQHDADSPSDQEQMDGGGVSMEQLEAIDAAAGKEVTDGAAPVNEPGNAERPGAQSIAKEKPRQRWLLSVHFAERREQPLTVSDPCHCDRGEWEYARETVRYSLTEERKPLPDDRYCDCSAHCDHEGASRDRGPHHCLCKELTERARYRRPPALSKLANGLYGNRDKGVALAYVTLVEDACHQLRFDTVEDACDLRRLVIGNEMLYDLARGRDLTQIAQVSWWKSHRKSAPLKWKEFADMFEEDGTTGFTITFSGPVQADTVTADCFAITAIFEGIGDDWGRMLRMPLTEPSLDPTKTIVTLMVDEGWVRSKINQDESQFTAAPARLEIEVRGDFILDCCGQAIDANAIGLRPPPTGNGSPGGTFLSTILVERHEITQKPRFSRNPGQRTTP